MEEKGFFGSPSAMRNLWYDDDPLKKSHPVVDEISPVAGTHLLQVYSVLFCALLKSYIGSYLHTVWNIGGLFTTVGLVVTMAWFAKTPPNKERMRISLLLASAALYGASTGPIVAVGMNASPRLFIGAFIGGQMLARPRDLKILVGFLGGMVFSSLLIYPIFGELVGTLIYFYSCSWAIFGVCMIGDSRHLVEKADNGDLDYVKHALIIFIDSVASFVRILVMISALFTALGIEVEEYHKEEEEQKKMKELNLKHYACSTNPPESSS